jgi:hypothetical protein
MQTLYKVIIAILCLLLGYVAIIKPFYNKISRDKEAQIESDIILEKSKKILQMATVEGNFNELVKYNQADFDFPGFRKKALVQVKAHALIGYKMEGVTFETFPKEKKLIINNFPPPEILALETDFNYYDLEDGFFNEFSKEDYNVIQKRAKKIIVQKIEKSDLFKQAEEQKLEMLSMLLFAVSDKDWTIIINGKKLDNNFNIYKK